VFGVAYVITLVAGFISNRNLNDPLEDPHLAITELLILVMVAIAVAGHGHGPDRTCATGHVARSSLEK